MFTKAEGLSLAEASLILSNELVFQKHPTDFLAFKLHGYQRALWFDPNLLQPSILVLSDPIKSAAVMAEVDRLLNLRIAEGPWNSFDRRHDIVFRLRFGLEDARIRTLDEVGEKVGVTRERVRQVIKQGAITLKKYYSEPVRDLLLY
jgi:hypothetical protein